MTKKVLEAEEEICDIAGGGAPGRVVYAVAADAGDFTGADECGLVTELAVAVSPESHLSIGVICAGFWGRRPAAKHGTRMLRCRKRRYPSCGDWFRLSLLRQPRRWTSSC